MRPETVDHLHDQSVAALDATYANLLRLARQGMPGAKAQLAEVVALLLRLTGDTERQAEQQHEVDALLTRYDARRVLLANRCTSARRMCRLGFASRGHPRRCYPRFPLRG